MEESELFGSDNSSNEGEVASPEHFDTNHSSDSDDENNEVDGDKIKRDHNNLPRNENGSSGNESNGEHSSSGESNKDDWDSESNHHFGENTANDVESEDEKNLGQENNADAHAGTSDEDSDESVIGRKNITAEDNVSSENEDAERDENLFGDADDISSSDEENVYQGDEHSESRKVEELSDNENISNIPEQMPKEQLETRIEVEIPKIGTDLGTGIHFVRFPNFISVEARPFDAAVYEDEIEEDELLDEEGRTRLKLKVENTIRWKKYTDENGIELTESNARTVHWSDGSMSLHLGSEIFDVHQMSLQGDHNHLFIRQGTGLQGQAVFKTKLTFRPHSTKSATHKKMTNRLAMRHNQNQQKVRVLPIAGQDPESRKADLMKKEEDQLKAHVRREAQKRRMREKSHARGLSNNYIEEDADDEESVSAIKNRFKSAHNFRKDHSKIYTSDSESEGEKKLLKFKRFASDDEDDDDEILDIGAKRKKEDETENRRKTYIESDEEEVEEGVDSNNASDDSL
uniref:RNA polymerase-associated protein LEO1 n=1 Tax=Phallusia mammillata TaxID=59560 RepID=A0A6F9DIS6_9ASCI|nr:uncharacterized protein LOC494392 [Phallusia mammillata]